MARDGTWVLVVAGGMDLNTDLDPAESLTIEVLQARTAAAQAEQRATDAEARVLGARNEGVVDTRLLGKPKSFDGAMDNRRQFKFTFLGNAGAVNATLKQAMIEKEVMQEAAIMNSVLPVGDQQASTVGHIAQKIRFLFPIVRLGQFLLPFFLLPFLAAVITPLMFPFVMFFTLFLLV